MISFPTDLWEAAIEKAGALGVVNVIRRLLEKWVKGEIYSGTLKNSCGEIEEIWELGQLQIDEKKQNEKLGLLNHLEICSSCYDIYTFE